jgi:hypothetical protein
MQTALQKMSHLKKDSILAQTKTNSIAIFFRYTTANCVASWYAEELVIFLNKQLFRTFAYIASLLTGYPPFNLTG